MHSDAGSRKGSQRLRSSTCSSLVKCMTEIKESVNGFKESVDQLKERMEKVEVKLDASEKHPLRSSTTSKDRDSSQSCPPGRSSPCSRSRTRLPPFEEEPICFRPMRIPGAPAGAASSSSSMSPSRALVPYCSSRTPAGLEYDFYNSLPVQWNAQPVEGTGDDFRASRTLPDFLPKFRGDTDKYFMWHSAFLLCIHRMSISVGQKVLNMRACIDRSSYPLIAVLRELSNPNRMMGYSGAIQMLEELYGGTESLHHQVYQDVRDIWHLCRRGEVWHI